MKVVLKYKCRDCPFYNCIFNSNNSNLKIGTMYDLEAYILIENGISMNIKTGDRKKSWCTRRIDKETKCIRKIRDVGYRYKETVYYGLFKPVNWIKL